jgi:hypothetical protein
MRRSLLLVGLALFPVTCWSQCSPSPHDANIIECEKWTPLVASGNGAGWSPWYEVVSDPNPGYSLVTVTFQLEGDHPCKGSASQVKGEGSWAACEQVARSDDSVKWRFKFQGKQEALSPNSGVIKEKALLRTSWKKKSPAATQ